MKGLSPVSHSRQLAIVCLLLAAACDSGERAAAQTERCDLCGMVVPEESGWNAGGVGVDAQPLHFDTPKCLFRHVHTRGAVNEPWVTEYYAQERREADALFYVLGSDVRGPMGRDLVPIEGHDAAERFRSEHEGEAVLAYDAVTAAVAEALFTPSE